MTPQMKALKIIVERLNSELGINLIAAPLPVDGGVSAEITGDATKYRYLDINHGRKQLAVLFLAKDESQGNAYNQLCRIENCLDMMKSISDSEVFIEGAVPKNSPVLVSNDGRYYVYSMTVGINITF